MERKHADHGERIAALEQATETLADDLRSLASIVREGHEATRSEIRKIGDAIGTIGRPNYGTWIAAGGLVVTLGIAVFTPTWLRLDTFKHEFDALESAVQTHHVLPVHPVAANELATIGHTLGRYRMELDLLNERTRGCGPAAKPTTFSAHP